MATTSTLIWEDRDPDENNGEWPYPTEYKRYRIEGDLADMVRKRTGLTGEVTIYEENISGGYSEWTQESDYPFQVEVDGKTVYQYEGSYSLMSELKWNDGEIPKYGFNGFNNWLSEGE